MSVAQNAVLRVVATLSYGAATKAQNVYHVQMDTAADASEADVLDAALEYVEAILGEYDADCGSTTTLDEVEVYEWDGFAWSPVGTITGTWAGSGSGFPLLAGAALLVNAFKPRSGYSDKKYFGGFLAPNLVENTWQSAILASGAAAGALWVAPFDNSTVQFNPCSFDKKIGTVTLYSGSVSVDPRVSYQRRRKPGVGLT